MKEIYFNNTKFELEIKTSLLPNSGKGVFTKINISKGQLIGEYVGKIISSSEHLRNSGYTVFVSRKISIDASEFPRSYMAMINDANSTPFSNNCILKRCGKHVYVYCINDITAGSELYLQYGRQYWER